MNEDRCETYLDESARHTRVLDEDPEGPQSAVVVGAAEGDVHSLGHGVLAELTAMKLSNDASLLLLVEAGADESADDELLEGGVRGLGRVVTSSSAAVLTKVPHESDDGSEHNLEQLIALEDGDVLDIVPRVLVDGVDDALVGTDEVAVVVRRLCKC